MTTATPAESAGSRHIRESVFHTAQALNPGSTPEELALKASLAEAVINLQLQASPTWEAYYKNSKEMRQARLAQMSEHDRQRAKTICAEIEGRKAELLRRESFFCEHPEFASPGSVESRAQAMVQEATAAGIQVHSQTCSTCSKRNYSFLNEAGELKRLLKRCIGCKTAMYCSVECQKQAWPSHRVECLNIQRGTR